MTYAINERGVLVPRPKKCRRVCSLPRNSLFIPNNFYYEQEEVIIMNIEEYEALRLIDYENFTQEDAAKYMNVARSTIQQIYADARKKLSKSIVEGRPLKISGGNYEICEGTEDTCSCGGCNKHKTIQHSKIHGGRNMKIAVTYENGQVFQHFGHTEKFGIYQVEDNKISNMEVVDTNGQGHGALAGFLQSHKVNALICGGIGGGAQTALANAGIKIYGGVSGDADEAVKALISGQLEYNPEANCDHHDHEHGHGHNCGDHSHGGNCHNH